MSAIGPVRAMAALLGASSPSTTWATVMMRKARAETTPIPATVVASPKTGSSRSWKAGSPAAPRPRDETVIPSWQAER